MSQWKSFFKKAGFKQEKASVTKIWTDAFGNCYEYLLFPAHDFFNIIGFFSAKSFAVGR